MSISDRVTSGWLRKVFGGVAGNSSKKTAFKGERLVCTTLPVSILIFVLGAVFAPDSRGFNANDTVKTVVSDGSASDTIAAINYINGKNQDGWVLTIGAPGASYTWTTAVQFNITDQSWTVQGASPSDRPTISVSSQCKIIGGAATGKIVTVKDIKWRNAATVDGLVSLEGSSGNVGPNYRVTNCEFLNNGAGTARSVFCEEYGLIDNCTFLGSDENRIWIRNDNIDWTGTHTFGTVNNVVIEDCKFMNSRAPGSIVMSQVLDGDRGMRVIFRYNTITNGNTEAHGYTSGAGNEGLQMEIHNNTFVLWGNSSDAADWAVTIFRGGTGVVYSNTVVKSGGFWGASSMIKFRAEQPEAYPAPHQPGQGLIANNTLGRVPIYCWANTWPSGTSTIFQTGEGTMVSGVDYYPNTPKPNYIPLQYPHPLRTGSPNPTPDTTAPTVPTGLVASIASSTQINITWNASSDNVGVTGYEIFRNGGTTPIATVSSPSYSNTGLVAGTSYSYQVAAVDGAGNRSARSVPISAATPAPDTQAPSVPAGVAATATSANEVQISWSLSTDNENVAGYEIYRNGSGSPIGTSATGSYSDTAVQPSTSYNYEVVAYDASSNKSARSAVASVTTPAGTPGNVYYIDQTVGNDQNSGTSPSSAWKNCPGMSGTSAFTGSGQLRPGDTVYFDRGDTWNVSSANNGGFYLLGGVRYVGNAYGAGTRATIRANAACAAGVVRFRDHPTLQTEFEGFEVDVNNQVANGIDINTAFWQLMNGATKRVKDCEVHHNWSRASQGQYTYGIIVSNHGGTGGYAENVEIINCVVHDSSRDAICLYPGDENGNCRIRNILVRGCEAYSTGLDPDYDAGAGILVKGYVVDAVIENNYVHDAAAALVFVNGNETRHFNVGPTNIHIRNNIFAGPSGQGAILIYDGSSGKDPKDVKIYGNLFYNNTSLGGIWVDNGVGNTLSLLVYNNSFYNSPVVINNNSATVTALEFKNNILHWTGGVPLVDSQGKITAHSNNLYYRGSGTLVSSGGVNYSASTLSNYEPTALSVDPAFKNTGSLPTGFVGIFGSTLAPNADGLSLQITSPAIDKGASLVSPFNGSVNSAARPSGAAWDIGAYEFASSTTIQEPTAPTGLQIVP